MTDPDTTDTAATTGATDTTRSTITPYITVRDSSIAIDWYRLVFGATEVVRYIGDDGRIGHAELEIGGATVYLSDEYVDIGVLAPPTMGGTSVGLNLEVDDVDAVWEHAIAADATGVSPPSDQSYGERSSTIIDPFGHRWMVQTRIATPTYDEIDAAMPGFTVRPPTSSDTPAGSGRDARPVEIGYLTMAFDDVDRARAFYRDLFDWRTEEGNMGSGYAHVANTQLPMGMTPSDGDETTTLYFRVDDVDACADRAVELGGRIVSRSEFESGIDVVCMDDQGSRFHIHQFAEGY